MKDVVDIPGLEIHEELGRGGQCVVFRVTRNGESYALKVPLLAETEAARRHHAQRFRREAVARARARHPGIPDVLEIGETGGNPYLLLDLAQGETLTDRLRRGPLPVGAMLEVGLSLADALAALHATGLVHRDVKPSNMVMSDRELQSAHPASTHGCRLAARLIDFGLVTEGGRAGAALGTPRYVPPELHDGKGCIGPSADVYALGRVLTECVTNANGAGVTELPAGVRELLERMTLAGADERPSARDVGSAIEQLLVDPEHLPRSLDERAVVLPRLIGRYGELQRLRAAWGAAQSGGRGMVLTGAPGSGKTALLRTLCSEVGATCEVLEASCHPRDPATFSAARQLLDGYVRRTEQLRDDAQRRRRFDLLRSAGGDLGSVAKLLSPSLSRVFKDAPTVPTTDRADHIFVEGLATFLRRLIERLGPTLVCVDDAQWIDAGSRRVLARTVAQAEELPCLYLLVARDDPDSRRGFEPVIESLDAGPVGRLELPALSSVEVLDVARSFLGTRELPRDVERAVSRLADGTPLGVMEFLRVLLDEGALYPHWGKWRLDPNAVGAADLPRSAVAALMRRIASLEEEYRDVLRAAAVIGMIFEVGLVADMIGLAAGEVEGRLRELVRANLVEPFSGDEHRFVHHRVREALLRELSDTRQQALHLAAARAIDNRLPDVERLVSRVALLTPSLEPTAVEVTEFADVTRLYAAASHYAEVMGQGDFDRMFEVAVAAARCAFAAFDNQRALRLFEAAQRFGELCERQLDAEGRFVLAESTFRQGAAMTALSLYEEVARQSADVELQVVALARISFIHESRLESDLAWPPLEEAFARLGVEAPRVAFRSAGRDLWSWSSRGLKLRRRSTVDGSRRRRELLGSLYFQAARLSVQTEQPERLLVATARLLPLAEALGPSAVLVKAWLSYSFVLAASGLKRRGTRYLQRAERLAQELSDPVTYSHALQVHGVIAIWGGDTNESVAATTRCLEEYGHWRELSEYYITAHSQAFIEWLRGRLFESWFWLESAVKRINQAEGVEAVPDYLDLAARATLIALGRDVRESKALEHLRNVTSPVPPGAAQSTWTFSPAVRQFTERMDLGDEFEELVRRYRSFLPDFRRAHIFATAFSLDVAHARVHQCLRAPPGEREEHMAELETALSDLRAAARIPLLKAHTLAIEGYHAYLTGHPARAREWFQKAEALALSENAPWVMYAVYRGRAHMLRDAGRPDAARDQAKLAEHIAREHGAVYRVKFIREEFALDLSRPGLPGSAAVSEVGVTGYTMGLGSSRARRQLRALVRISQSRGTELDPDELARSMVDEVVRALRAQRGALYLDAELATASAGAVDSLGVVTARDAEGRDLSELRDRDDTVIRAAYATGSGAEDGAPNGVESVESAIGTTARHATIAAPLTIGNRTMGVVYLDRDVGEGLFTAEDGDVLSVLAAQVGLGLELVETLIARERAEQGRRHAEKMDAMGRLAGGIAHDMKNMLAAIRDSTTGILESPWDRESVLADAQTIRTATERAEELTRQLGSFPSGDAGRREAVQLNDRISRLAPVLRGLLGDGVQLELSLVEPLSLVVMDPEQLDQVLMNLATNARDAMPSGGRVRIATREVKTEAEQPPRPAGLKGRTFVELSVTDTGEGMSEGTREQVFEPYFTTKRARGGTGLGLATVYDVVHRAGGEVEVESGLGEGSTFRIRLPRGPARLLRPGDERP